VLRAGTLPLADSTMWNPSFFWSALHFALTFFAASFLLVVNAGFRSFAAASVSLASWAANRALNLSRASSMEFKVYFLFGST
jgi:hypothetical protein